MEVSMSSYGFWERFEKTHGKGSIDKFKDMIEQPECTLSEVGEYFGFTKEYARVVYKNIYGVQYAEIFRKKKEERKRLREKGLNPVIQLNGRSFQLLVNGHKIAVRSSKALQSNKRRYFHLFRIRRCSDFIIFLCHENEKETFYVIPLRAIPESGINIPAGKDSRGKYSGFKGAWHLLADHPDLEDIN
jgi:hypothetical protein